MKSPQSPFQYAVARLRMLFVGTCLMGMAHVALAQGATQFTHDTLDRLTRTTQPDGSQIEHVYDAAGNILQTKRVSRHVLSSLDDNFDGEALRADYWTGYDNGRGGSWIVSGGEVLFGNCTGAHTRDKVELVGQRFVLTSRFSGRGAYWDSHFEIVDPDTGLPYLQAGDTNYGDGRSGGRPFGMYLYIDNRATVLSFNTTSAWKEYELTIDRDQVTLKRGDSLDNLTEVLTATLPHSIEGKRYSVEIGTGCGYSPALFDWVHARAE
jgi:YD repeat-containing protein